MQTITPNEFVAKWKHVTSRERQVAQEHFIDLCHLVGHPTPNEDDHTGKRFAFEMGVNKSNDGQGWADVAKLGYFGWEYKGKDHDLNKAYDQLLLYRGFLQNPPLLVVSDINTIIIRTNFTNLPTRAITITLDDFLKPETLKILKSIFFNPDELKPNITVEGVTEEAARHFSELAGVLRKRGETPQVVAHFLIRLIFCLFAEDIGLLPEKLFPRLLDQTRRNPRDFASVLSQLFGVMQNGGFFGPERILHFNGGLFDNNHVLELDSDALEIIAKIDALDWGQMEPSIFGTLFERGLDPAKRSQLGAHYTSKDDILLIVEPVLMAPLRREWQSLKAEVEKIKGEIEGLEGKKRTKAIEPISAKLRAFADKIASIRVLDPACGSGNFLYVALQLLLDLQNEVINYSDELGAGRFFITVTPAQLFGIELNEYAHELAQVTIWIGYIQWLANNGYGLPPEPILKAMDNIRQMDAILAIDTSGKPIGPIWPEADVIIGNPPFLGDKKMRAELGHQYVETLRNLYENRIPGQSDLVCYWFEKAREMIVEGKAKCAGLLATQGIRGGANRKVLERIKETGNIFWAQSDREWILDGATVHVSMIGFDNGKEQNRELNGLTVKIINSDLSSSANTVSASTLIENSGISFIGTQKSGPFDLTPDQAKSMVSASNPNGRSNKEVIKPWINAIDIVREPRGMLIIDFGTNMPLQNAAQFELPFEYVKKHVKPFRDTVRRKNHREKWWLFGETRTGMRKAIKSLPRFIVTPMVSKHRIFAWVNAGTIPENLLVVIARSDDYFLGVLHSHIHEVWSRQKGTQLREASSGQRYTPTSTFETFPFPWPPGHEPAGDALVECIAQAAKDLVEMRDRWLNVDGLSDAARKKRTLTNLYNARPTWLDLVHKKLDAAVFGAYSWPDNLSDEDILSRLLELNKERSG
jgi:type II restriction/modification system DNA methylase subunit YeeA